MRIIRATQWIMTCAFVLTAGGASASIPAADGTYTGCYLMAFGSLRVIDAAIPGQRCLDRIEVQVTWSQRGPTGPAGPAGASVTSAPLLAGDPTCPNGGTAFLIQGKVAGYACNGTPGPAGGARAITADNFSAGFTAATLSTSLSSPTTLLTLALPTGHYVLQATVGLHVDVPLGTLNPFVNARCAFFDSGGQIGTDFSTGVGGSPTSDATLPMLATYGAATADLVSVRCSADAGLAVQARPSVAVAIAVAP